MVAVASPLSTPNIKFASYEIDVPAGRLLKNGIPVKLQPQPLRVLQLLSERPGQVITREEIQKCLWGDSTFVDFERGINFCINQIRGVLNDNAEKPRYIETLPRIGYRFIAPVSGNGRPEAIDHRAVSGRMYVWPADPSTSAPSKAREFSPEAADRKPFPRTFKLVAVITAMAVVVGSIAYGTYRWRSHTKPNLDNIQISRVTNNGKAEDVAISPDGSYVAYLYRDGENTSLRLRQVSESGEALIVVHDPLLVPGLTFSLDGKHLYFLRAAPNDTLHKDLYEVPILGGPEQKIRANVESTISFSPDGQQFSTRVAMSPTMCRRYESRA